MKPERSRVMITGATGGIGQAAAYRLAQAGAALMLVGRTPAALSAEAQSLAGIGSGDVRWLPVDLTDLDATTELAEAAARWGCNTVIHGAAVPCFGRIETVGVDRMEAVLQTNLLAPMRLTRALLPHLRTQARAQLLFIGSLLGAVGAPGFSVYAATKFGLRGFAQSLRRELAETHVRVQYLGPRNTRTRFNDASVQAYNQATGNPADLPEYVAEVLLEMLADEAAERFVGWPQKLIARVNGLLPELLDPGFGRYRKGLEVAETVRPA